MSLTSATAPRFIQLQSKRKGTKSKKIQPVRSLEQGRSLARQASQGPLFKRSVKDTLLGRGISNAAGGKTLLGQ